MKIDRVLLIEWIERAKEALPGEVVYVAAEDKHTQKALVAGFKQELDILHQINPRMAASIVVVDVFKDRQLWVALRKSGAVADVGFYKDREGRVSRIKIDTRSIENARVRKQMEEDGLCLPEKEEEEK